MANPEDEMAGLGRLLLKSELEALYIKELRIEERANEHGRLSVRFLPAKKLGTDDVLRYQERPVRLLTMDGELVFSGIWTSLSLICENEYQEVQGEAGTFSVAADRERKRKTFQSPKTLGNVINQGIGAGALVNLDSDVAITEMLFQEDETDWAFGRRIANQYQKLLFVNSRAAGCQLHVGAAPFRVKKLGAIESAAVSRNVDKVRKLRGNVNPEVSVFEFEETELVIYDLSVGVGYAVTYQGRLQIVVKSIIASGKGGVLNTITLVNEEGIVPAVSLSQGGTNKCSILTGVVLETDLDNVKVDFFTPGDTPRWLPYANTVSNYFYCMPDVGDRVYVYYETGDGENIVCLGSRHVSRSPDFGNYKDKLLTANNRMVKFGDKELDIVGNRSEFDGNGGNQAKITFGAGMEIVSTQDISLETTDEGKITIQSVKADFAGFDRIKQKFTEHYGEGDRTYKADGGAGMEFDAMGCLQSREFDKLKQSIMQNIAAPLQIIDTVKELAGRIGGSFGTGVGTEINAPAPPEFTEGVIDLTALERLAVQVGSTCVIFSGGVIQVRAGAYLQLGADRGFGYQHLDKVNHTWGDMLLDVTQCVLDIVGCLPIPGISGEGNPKNKGSLSAGGNDAGAAMSAAAAAIALIPQGGFVVNGDKSAKTSSKAAKVRKTARSLVKMVRNLSTGAGRLNLNPAGDRDTYAAGASMLNGAFGLSDPKCQKDSLSVIQLSEKRFKSRGEREAERGAGKAVKKKTIQGIKDAGNKRKERAGTRLDERPDNRCKGGDPIDMVTGSFSFDQCDMIINDILGINTVERTYESLLCREDSPIGPGWSLSLFSRANPYDDRVEVLLPDGHTETFLKTGEGFRNRRNGTRSLALFAEEGGYRLDEALTGLSRFYDTAGLLRSVTDANKNQTLYQYGGKTLNRITFASGQFLELSWEGDRLAAMRDCIGRLVRYRYKEGLLIEAELVNGGAEQYAYDSKGRLSKVTDANGTAYVHNEYDARDRVTRQKLSTGQEYILLYADDDRTNTCIRVREEESIRYIYNKDRQLIRREYGDGTADETGYDSWENKIFEKDRAGNVTHRSYDEYGHLLEERQPNGLVSSYEFDAEGRCVEFRDNAGLLSRYSYDKNGNLTGETERLEDSVKREVRYEYDRYGRITAFTDPCGNRETYEYRHKFHQADTFVTPEGGRFRYELDQAGRAVSKITDDGIWYYAYNHYDLLCMETDPLGNTAKYVYDRVLDLVRLISPNHFDPYAGREPAMAFGYDAFHRRITQTDETGAVYAALLDGEGRVVKEVNPNAWDSGSREGEGIFYSYDGNGHRSVTRYPDGGVERSWHDALGNLVKLCRPEQYEEKADAGAGYEYRYDSMSRLIQVTGPDGTVLKRYVYDLRGNVTKVIDAAWIDTGDADEERIGELYAYNYAGWLLESRKPVSMEDGQTRYQVVQYRYNLSGSMIQERRYCDCQSRDSASGGIHVLTYEYDREGRLTRVSDRTGAVITYGYDRLGRRTYETRRINEEAFFRLRYQYDAGGRMTELIRTADREGCGKRTVSVRYEYDKNGNNIRTSLPAGGEIRRKYDAADRLVSESHVDKAGGIENTTRFQYDKAGNLTVIIDNLGHETRIEYDLMNREILRKSADGGVTRKFYDRNGRLIKLIRPSEYEKNGEEGAGSRYVYDALGRIVTVLGPDGRLLESRAYDAAGNVIKSLDGVGAGAEFRYDLGGRRTEITTQGKAAQKYEYDAWGNITGVADGAGNRTEYVLDKWGRIVEIKQADGTSEYYGYDYAGNLIKSTDGVGNTTEYEYNGAGQMTAVTDPEGEKERYAYDEEGRLCRKTGRNGAETFYTYNIYGNPLFKKAGNLSERYEYTPEGLLKSAISQGMRYGYVYDVMGRLTDKTASGRTLLSLSYDRNGNLSRQSDVTGKVTEYRYDLMDQVESVWDDGNCVARYEYNPDKTVKRLVNGESLYTEYSYDLDKNLTGLKTMLGEVVLTDNYYRHDGNGNILEKRQLGGLTSYSYDRLNRLAAAEYPDQKEELFYDKAGNRLRRICREVEECYEYDRRNRLITYTKGGESNHFGYDRAGNLIRDNYAWYEYDAFNRTAKVETFDGNIQVNHYDPEGLRHEMEENGKLVGFLFREREVVAEETQENIVRYIRGIELLASDAKKAATYYHYASDELGSITYVTDGSKVLNRYEYDAWGNETAGGEQVENRFKYSGQQYDPISRQYYLRARYYNPVIGRFTQEDTCRGDGLNLYAYCAGNPVCFVDPSGNICEKKALTLMQNVLAGVKLTRRENRQLKDRLCDKVRSGTINAYERQIVKLLEIDIDKVRREAPEFYYRTMSPEDYNKLMVTGRLQSTRETFISPSQSFAQEFSGVTVEFEVTGGTTSQLEQMGLKNESKLIDIIYPDMPKVKKGWVNDYAHFKVEANRINIGLGQGKGLELFNNNIISFKKVRGD